MMPQTLTRPSESTTSTDNEISHTVCQVCYPDEEVASVSLCGVDLTVADHWCPPDFSCGCLSCAVCDDMEIDPCPKCGW